VSVEQTGARSVQRLDISSRVSKLINPFFAYGVYLSPVKQSSASSMEVYVYFEL
jgi:hypothetical protein